MATGAGAFRLVEGAPLPGNVFDNNTSGGPLIRHPNGTDANNAFHDRRFTVTFTPGAGNVQTP